MGPRYTIAVLATVLIAFSLADAQLPVATSRRAQLSPHARGSHGAPSPSTDNSPSPSPTPNITDPSPTPTIAAALAQLPQLSRFASLLVAAAANSERIAHILSNSTTNVTVLAPNNAAFDTLAFMSGMNISDLVHGSPAYLELLLLSHMIPFAMDRQTMLTLGDGSFVPTLNPQVFFQIQFVGSGNQILLSSLGSSAARLGIMVLPPVDIKAGNSFIHVIDTVIIPIVPPPRPPLSPAPPPYPPAPVPTYPPPYPPSPPVIYSLPPPPPPNNQPPPHAHLQAPKRHHTRG